MDSTLFAARGPPWLLTTMFPFRTLWPTGSGVALLYGPTSKMPPLLLQPSLPLLPPLSPLPSDLGLVVLKILFYTSKILKSHFIYTILLTCIIKISQAHSFTFHILLFTSKPIPLFGLHFIFASFLHFYVLISW